MLILAKNTTIFLSLFGFNPLKRPMYFKTVILVSFSLLLLSCGVKKQEEANSIIENFIQKKVGDRREVVFDVRVQTENGHIILTGETDSETLKKQIAGLLDPFEIEDKIVILPDSTVGDKTYGLVTLSLANLRSSPTHSAELATQALLGTPVKILKRKGSWFLIQTPDNYISWVDDDGISPKTQMELNRWKSSKRILFTGDNGAIYDSSDLLNVLSDVTTGCILEEMERTEKTVQVAFPDGRIGFSSPENWVDFNEFKSTVQLDTLQLKILALSWMGRPYLWGGTSARAMDCSGFVKMLYFMNGVLLARDASLQTRHGETIIRGENYTNVQTGDLLFFGTKESENQPGRVTHVALSLGGTEFIHASGRIRMNSFNTESKLFSEYRKNSLVMAKRILGTEEGNAVQRIKEHPWY